MGVSLSPFILRTQLRDSYSVQNYEQSADFVLISVENDHNFEQNKDRATVIFK